MAFSLNSFHINGGRKVVFVGAVLNKHVTWKPHISRIANKVSKTIGILYKSSFFISKSSLRTLYYSLVYVPLPSLLHNCMGFKKLFYNKDTFDAHTELIFADLKLLGLHQIHLFQEGKSMCIYKSGLLPKCFSRSAKSYYLLLYVGKILDNLLPNTKFLNF